MRVNGADQLKSKLFAIDEFNEIISNFKNQIESFSHYEKKRLRNGRHNKFYE